MAKRRSNHNFRAEGFTPVANTAWAEANRDMSRGSAASKHIVKNRKGTKAARNKQAIKDFSY
jgi:hypothetical protein